jgi:hypothetical protein
MDQEVFMRSSIEGHEPTRGQRIALGLAPHVDPDWAEDFAIELRLLGVTGARIGDALGEVNSHYQESKERAPQAFGDPADYARSLQLPIHPGTSPRAMLFSLSPIVLQVLGVWMLIRGFTAWRESGQLEITTAQLAVVVVFVLLASLLARFADPVKRFYAHQPMLTSAIAVASGVALEFGFSSRFHSEGIWQVAAGWSLAAGSAAQIGGIVWVIMRRLNSGSPDGPVTSPLDPIGKDLGYYGIPGPLLKLVSSSMLGPVLFTSGTLFLLAVIWWLTR